MLKHNFYNFVLQPYKPLKPAERILSGLSECPSEGKNYINLSFGTHAQTTLSFLELLGITKYVYIKSTTVYVPSSELGLSRQRVCPSPRNQKGGGAHSPAGEGLGESQFRRLEKRLSNLLLCVGH
jgi:hypothetical protein